MTKQETEVSATAVLRKFSKCLRPSAYYRNHSLRRKMAPPLAGFDAKTMSAQAASGSSLPASTSFR